VDLLLVLVGEGSCGRVFSDAELRLVSLALVAGTVALALLALAWTGKMLLTWWGWRR
jgi:hypothetical protein